MIPPEESLMRSARHIGIVAVSAEGAALCYRTICSEGAASFGVHGHPEISMHSFPLAEYVRHIDVNAWDKVGELLLESATRVVGAGADFLICPDNTVHQGVALIRDRSPAPWLHIAEEVGTVAVQRGFRRLGIMGTRSLMEGPVYPVALERLSVAFEFPEAADRQRIDDVIYQELVRGRIEEESRVYFQSVIRGLANRGCDAVVLGCTEIPLLISQSDSPLPAIDSTRTLARAALREAVGAKEA